MQHRPDLRLPGRQQAMERGRDDRDLGGLVSVRERRHRGASDERGLEPVSAGGAVLDDQSGQGGPEAVQEAVGAQHLAPQSLAGRLRMVATQPDRLVVVDLEVAEAALAQHVGHPRGQSSDHPGVGHVPEPAHAHRQRHAVPGEEVSGLRRRLGVRADRLELEPDAGDEASRPQSVGDGFQAGGEVTVRDLPVAVRAVPVDGLVVGPEPAGVDDEVGGADAVVVQPVGDAQHRVVGRPAPGRTPLVDDHREPVFDGRLPQGGRDHGADQPVARVVERSPDHREPCLRGDQAIARCQGQAPVAELTVGQPAGQAEVVATPVGLQLPAAAPRQLGAPADPRDRVLDHGLREPPADGHRADLAEPLGDGSGAGVVGHEVHVLQGLRHQPALEAPGGAPTVQHDAAGGVVVGEGGDAGDGERRDEVDRDGPAPVVHERHARGENVAPVFERVVHHQAVVRVERGGDDAAIRGDVLPAQA